jgi:hypothetical protein
VHVGKHRANVRPLRPRCPWRQLPWPSPTAGGRPGMPRRSLILGSRRLGLLEGTATGSPAKTASPPTRPSQQDRDGSPGGSRPRPWKLASRICHGSGPHQRRRLPTAEAGTRLSTQPYEQRLTQTFLDQLLPPGRRHTRNTDEAKHLAQKPPDGGGPAVAGMRSKTATRWRRTGATAIPVHYRRAFSQLNAGVVGLAGLEPAPSS